ncbi:tyrosine-type recombinase/integrase [Agrobacterium burrii]
MKREGSSNAYFEKRIPSDLTEIFSGKSFVVPLTDDPNDAVRVKLGQSPRSIRFSLRTPSKSESIKRQAAAINFFEARFAEYRDRKPLTLGHRESIALAGVLYRGWADGPDKTSNIITVSIYGVGDSEISRGDRDAPEHAAGAAEAFRTRIEEGDTALLDGDLKKIIERLLTDEGFPYVAEETKQTIVEAFRRSLVEGIEAYSKRAGGDYSRDPVGDRFPTWETPRRSKSAKSAMSGEASLTGLVNSWWKEAKALGRSESTYESYGNSFRLLSRFLGHDDALRVAPEDIIRFKDFRLSTPSEKTGKPVSPKTLKGSDLTAFESVFDWAVSNRKLPSNPASGVTVKMGKKVKLRERDFTDDEAAAILRGANAVDLGPTPRNSLKTRLAKRWVPWLCAYSGSRLGELVQLRKEDFREEEGAWIMRVTPEAGTVKGKEFRDVPLHPHLVAMGFVEMVQTAKGGYLFMDIKEGSTFRGVWQSKKNRLAEFAREYVKDPNVAPNHGWRHTFKSKGFEAGIQEKVLDAICGHAPSSVGRSYGTVTLRTKIDAIRAFPLFFLTRRESGDGS